MYQFFNKKGFTLLEMLVVMGIVGIILGVVTVSFSTSQKKARDAKRKTELQSLQNCLEQYFSSSGLYQYPIITISGGILQANCGVSGPTISITDPLNDNASGYVYKINKSAVDSYNVSDKLEGGGSFIIQNLQ